jgi:hypothetical protein
MLVRVFKQPRLKADCPGDGAEERPGDKNAEDDSGDTCDRQCKTAETAAVL